MIYVRHWSKIIGVFVCIAARALGLELLELRVPPHVPLGARAQLACRWQLGAQDVLYSVKWYKDGHEFFRHVPRDLEPRRQFLRPGVQVEKADAAGATLTLGPAVLETGGRYRCEVSGERPLFLTVSDHADMLVVALPSAGPCAAITGLRRHYAPGDRVQASCTAGRSRPAAGLAWFVNGQPAPPAAVAQTESRETDGLTSSRLELDFVIAEEDFKDSFVKIKCLATLGPTNCQSNEQSAQRLRVPAYGHVDVENSQLDRPAETRQSRQPSASAASWRGNYFIICYVLFSLYIASNVTR